MKIGDTAKHRIQLIPGARRWVLVVDRSPLISTTDRRWLRRFAVKLRQALANESSLA